MHIRFPLQSPRSVEEVKEFDGISLKTLAVN